jgi:Predicted transcriptional regulator, contains C-terminal CBS domains
VSRDLTLEEYVQELLRTGRRCHLVVSDGELLGLMSLHTMNQVPREDWPVTSVQAAMVPRERLLTAWPDEPALSVLERMQSSDINQMPVLANGEVVGMISRESILRMLQTRAELGELSKA